MEIVKSFFNIFSLRKRVTDIDVGNPRFISSDTMKLHPRYEDDSFKKATTRLLCFANGTLVDEFNGKEESMIISILKYD